MPINTNAGNVKWQLEYSWQIIEGVYSAPTTISVVTPSDGVAWKMQIAAFDTLDGSHTTTTSSIIKFRVFRDPTDELDTYGSDAVFLEFDIHHRIDAIGTVDKF